MLSCHIRSTSIKYYGAFALSQSTDVKHVNSFQKTHTQSELCVSQTKVLSRSTMYLTRDDLKSVSQTATLQTLDVIDHTRCSTVSSGSARTSQIIQSVSVTQINHAHRSLSLSLSHTHTHTHTHKTSTSSHKVKCLFLFLFLLHFNQI